MNEKCSKCGKISEEVNEETRFTTTDDDEIVCSTCMKNRYIKMNILFSKSMTNCCVKTNDEQK